MKLVRQLFTVVYGIKRGIRPFVQNAALVEWICMPRMQLGYVTRRVEEWLVAVLALESVARLHTFGKALVGSGDA